MRKLFLLLLLANTKLHAEVKLPRLISNGMVLQRDVPLKIWGWAAPGEKVSLLFSSNKQKAYSAIANEKGEWSVILSKQKTGGPYYMKIEAGNHLVIENILIGDVWLCSGQSNMEQGMGARLKYKYAEEIATVNNDHIRHFLVPDKWNFRDPQTNVESGSWKAATPQNIAEFTAVGYFFAKELYAKYKIPIGLINAALGGSPAEAWISEGSLKKFPAYYDEMQKWKDDKLIGETESRDRIAGSAWINELNRADEGIIHNWKAAGLNDDDWQQVNIPDWPGKEKKASPGVHWFRKEILVPASMSGKAAKIELGRMTDADSVFINGRFAGTTTYQYPARRYELDKSFLKEGRNVIVIRLVSNGNTAGFGPAKPYELTCAGDTIRLAGNWKYKQGAVAASNSPATTSVRNKPGGLYNAMIAPLIPYSIKGAIWYQGETNANYPDNYQSIMETLVRDWRNKFQNKFPFLFVQLPNYMEAKQEPQEKSNWAVLRQQQLQTLAVPYTGMVTAIDIGEWNDLHPENKKEVSHRLFLLAVKLVYGEKKLVASGPLYQSMKAEGNKFIIRFTSTGTGLITKDCNELKQFAIAGADGKYKWAKAIIKNNTVVTWNDEIKEPVSVRYAWADNPEGANLYNKEGLPASPFQAGK
ncbi:MAG TPA: sialate O-acetylesterase [Chitinophagaceae bacterium]|jgi:sialate O-acetylesterase|nr:sialate O-acetylesterase [Chitinophagaceae bacterium]